MTKLTEHQEQVLVVDWCARNNLWAVSFPNGFFTNKKDGKFFGQIAKLKKEGYTPGFPDLLIMDHKGDKLLVEMKVKTGKLSKNQIIVHDKLDKMSQYVITCFSADDAISEITNYFSEG